jgi:hypothetical protein
LVNPFRLLVTDATARVLSPHRTISMIFPRRVLPHMERIRKEERADKRGMKRATGSGIKS